MFRGILVYVAAVSVYDGYLVLRSGDLIREFERNPVGSYLIEFNHGDPSLFLLVKAAGTVLVLVAMWGLHRRYRRLSHPVTYAIALFQSGLLLFLEAG